LKIAGSANKQAVQKGRAARRARKRSFELAQDRLEVYLLIRWSEAIERNETDGPSLLDISAAIG
jgi:hypothetical protein